MMGVATSSTCVYTLNAAGSTGSFAAPCVVTGCTVATLNDACIAGNCVKAFNSGHSRPELDSLKTCFSHECRGACRHKSGTHMGHTIVLMRGT